MSSSFKDIDKMSFHVFQTGNGITKQEIELLFNQKTDFRPQYNTNITTM
jgi:hypothetical protein